MFITEEEEEEDLRQNNIVKCDYSPENTPSLFLFLLYFNI